MVVSPEAWTSIRPTAFRSHFRRFAEWQTTICNTVNILISDCILVKLGFHMYSHLLPAVIPFFYVKERQLRIGRRDLNPGDLPSGESTFGRNVVSPDIRLVVDYKKFSLAISRLLVSVDQCCVKLLTVIAPQYSSTWGQSNFSSILRSPYLFFSLQSCSAEQKIWFLFGLQPLGQTFGVTTGSSY